MRCRSPFRFAARLRRWAIVATAAVGVGRGVGMDAAFAQGNPPAPAPAASAPNLFGSNPGFEESVVDDNLWDGVTRESYLSGRPFSAPVVGDDGFRSIALPPSVAFADLNGDGKPDLLVADGLGYFYFYANVGTAAEPKFRSAEIVPLFLSANPKGRPDNLDVNNRYRNLRAVPRFALADWRRSGLLDLVVGNYFGELFFIPNTGSAKQPMFRQPQPVESARLKPGPRDGLPFNLLAPVAADWQGNGRLDLLLGEGTYSANAVRLLENLGPGGRPQFSEDRMHYVAYGEGREVLIPTVVDFNQDGRPDLVVADRNGKVSLFLQPANGWKPGQETPFSTYLTFGGRDKLPGLVAPCAADFNGDGLFDLLFGLPNGRIAVALNLGTRGEPRFGPLQELKGAKRLPVTRVPPNRNPADWLVNTSAAYGNFLAYGAIVNAQEDQAAAPPEGGNCFKFGYWPSGNSVFASPADSVPPEARRFSLRHRFELKIGHTYTLTFQVRGKGVAKAGYRVRTDYRTSEAVDYKAEAIERGGVKKIYTLESLNFNLGGDFNATDRWTTVKKTFAFQPKSQDVPRDTIYLVQFEVDCELPRNDAVLYFDDFQLVESR
ncbi:MAG: VCBS repeat-containing protein [Verrucomicrobia bacterium]|nr:VCBS repeat-containing protein [Verrucomicrobiota bacterium]